jgi:hypothetical protein
MSTTERDSGAGAYSKAGMAVELLLPQSIVT